MLFSTLSIFRIIVSPERSGMFLKKVGPDDAGTYIVQARRRDDDVWIRSTEITVHSKTLLQFICCSIMRLGIVRFSF